MPSVSKAQHAFMGASSTPKVRAALRASGRKPAPQKVADEFLHADKGKPAKLPRIKLARIASTNDADESE